MLYSSVYFQLERAIIYVLILYFAAIVANDQPEYPPAFQKDMESIDVVNGTPAVITCHLNRSLTEKELTKLAWLKMPRQLLVRGALKITTNERISIVPQSSANVFQLQFRPVIKEDAGEYRCVFNHETGPKYKVVVVNIQVRPKVDIDPKAEVNILEGEYAFVTCNASGAPFPQFRWWMLPLSSYQSYFSQRGFGYYKENPVTVALPIQNIQPLDSYSLNLPFTQSENYLNLIPVHELVSKFKQNVFLRSGKLIINAVNRDMTGWYFCEAHNSVKPSAIKHTLLNVNYPPQVFLPQREVFLAPFGNVSLVCEFQAFPMAEVEWLLDGRLLNTVPCEHRILHTTTWCTEKNVEGLENQTSMKSKHGFSDSTYFPDYYGKAVKEVTYKRKYQFRTIDLIRSKNNLNLYGKRLTSTLYIWVKEAKHFGRYSCRMQTKHGQSEGFIRLRNKGGSVIEPFGYEDRRHKPSNSVSSAAAASQIAPTNAFYTKQELMFPYLLLKVTSSANPGQFLFSLSMSSTIVIVQFRTL